MNIFFKDLFGLFAIAEGVYERIRRIFVPPKAFSWQTLIYLSLFSWLMSSLTDYPIKNVIAFFGWIFLIAGTAWYTTDNPLLVPGTNLPIGALITGFLVSVFAFGNDKDMLTPNTIVLWPTISAIITAIPEFFEGTGTEATTRIPKQEERPKIVVLVACSMLLSCWLELSFVVNDWLDEYPSLEADSFQKSGLVLRLTPKQITPNNGVEVLKDVRKKVIDQLTGRRWSDVEKWLLNANDNVSKLGQESIDKYLASSEEKYTWNVEARVNNNKDGYKLDLLNIWRGPSSNPNGYYLQDSCLIDPIALSGNGSNVTVAEISCNPKLYISNKQPPPRQ